MIRQFLKTMRGWRRLGLALILAGVAFTTRTVTASADVEVIMTADNAYSFGWGTASGISGVQGSTAAYYGPIVNFGSASQFAGCPASGTSIPLSSKSSPGNPNGVERFVIPKSDIKATDTFYVIAWSDNSSWQGLLGGLRDTASASNAILTGDPNWEVCATGEDFGSTSTDNPTLAKVNEWIVRCNRDDGNLGPGTSGGWVRETKTFGQGNLFVDHSATNADPANALGKGYGPIPCIDGAARWMWFNADPNPAFNALRSAPGLPAGATDHSEFLIFRLEARTLLQDQGCMTLLPREVECDAGPVGPSGCYRVKFRVTNDSAVMANYITVTSLQGGTVTPAVIELLNPIGNGQQANREFIWCPPAGSNPASAAFSLSLLDQTAKGCCARRLTVELPTCPSTSECFQVPKVNAECIPGGPPGAVNLTMWIKKDHAQARMLYLVAPKPMEIAPQPRLLGPVAGTFGPIGFTVTGAAANTNPRRNCFWLNLQPLVKPEDPFDLSGPCCSEQVCVEMPFCGLPTPIPGVGPPVELSLESAGGAAAPSK